MKKFNFDATNSPNRFILFSVTVLSGFVFLIRPVKATSNLDSQTHGLGTSPQTVAFVARSPTPSQISGLNASSYQVSPQGSPRIRVLSRSSNDERSFSMSPQALQKDRVAQLLVYLDDADIERIVRARTQNFNFQLIQEMRPTSYGDFGWNRLDVWSREEFFKNTNTVWMRALNDFESYVTVTALSPEKSFKEIVTQFYSTYPGFPEKLNQQELNEKFQELEYYFEAISRQLEWKFSLSQEQETIWIPNKEDSPSPLLREAVEITNYNISTTRKFLQKINYDFMPFLDNLASLSENKLLSTSKGREAYEFAFGTNKLNYWDSLSAQYFSMGILNGRAQVIQELRNLRTIKEELAKKIQISNRLNSIARVGFSLASETSSKSYQNSLILGNLFAYFYPAAQEGISIPEIQGGADFKTVLPPVTYNIPGVFIKLLDDETRFYLRNHQSSKLYEKLISTDLPLIIPKSK